VKKFEQTGKWNRYQAVMKAVWADERIAGAVSDMDNLDKLRENIAASLDKTKLTQAEVESLYKYAAATRSVTCDGCDHLCSPHLEGAGAALEIGPTLRYLMYHDVYGKSELAKELFRKLPPAARTINNVDFTRAQSACPHNVDIAHWMRRATEVLA
jgi:predicted aldo/keto reductase-like oxidoreductase